MKAAEDSPLRFLASPPGKRACFRSARDGWTFGEARADREGRASLDFPFGIVIFVALLTRGCRARSFQGVAKRVMHGEKRPLRIS